MSKDDKPGPSKRVKYGDKDYEETLLKWFKEAEEASGNESDQESDADSDADFIQSDHDTDSEVELDENTTTVNIDEIQPDESDVLPKNYFFGKNRQKWSKVPPCAKNTRTLQHNIVLKCPGLKNVTSKTEEPEKVWNMLFDDEIISIILQWTNKRLAKLRLKYKNETKSDLRDLDVIELRSFIGLLLLTSIFKSNHEDIRSLFATDGSGRDIFRCVTNANRFAVILSALRFDDPETRLERKNRDILAPISQIFNAFISNCQKVYTIGFCACVDEMLVSFRGRAKFKMYMPKKPCKYGLKVMALTDARSGYLLNAYIYSGKDSDGRDLSEDLRKYSKPTQAVLRLAKPILGTNRNITADNWFSSIELVEALKEVNLTFVGTLKKNKKEIPPEFLPKRAREVGSSLYGFTNYMTMISHVTKKNKAVILVSSVHHQEGIDDGKPEIISYYNNTKGGVDSLDEKCSIYSSSRRTRRWPMAIFFRMLDISSVNSYLLHQSYRDNPKLKRYDFVHQLAMQLVKLELERRSQNLRITREVRMCIRRVLQIKEEYNVGDQDRFNVRKACRRCPASKRRKTAHFCIICKIPICMECTKRVCIDCAS